MRKKNKRQTTARNGFHESRPCVNCQAFSSLCLTLPLPFLCPGGGGGENKLFDTHTHTPIVWSPVSFSFRDFLFIFYYFQKQIGREREGGRGDVTNVISVWADSILAIVEAEQLDFCSQLLGNKLFFLFSGTLISLVPVAAIRHIESGVCVPSTYPLPPPPYFFFHNTVSNLSITLPQFVVSSASSGSIANL